MDRTDLSRRQIQATIDGVDITAAILVWSIGREAIGFEAAPSVSGEMVLGDNLAESIDPDVNARWEPGTVIRLQIADDSGTLADPPFGGYLKIMGANYNPGRGPVGSPQAPAQLVLELADSLAYAREPEGATEIQGAELGTSRTLISLIDLSLQSKNLTLEPQTGDPTPAGSYNYSPTYSGREPVIDWLHKRLWCQSDGTYGLWQDSQGRIRIFEVRKTAAYWRTLSKAQVPGRYPVNEEREQLPGRIKATSTLTRAVSKPLSDNWITTALDTDGTVIGYDRSFWDLRTDRELTTVRKYRRRGGSLQGADQDDDTIILFEETENKKEFDGRKRKDREVATVQLMTGNIDPDQEGSEVLRVGQINTTLDDFGRDGLVEKRRKITEKAIGLLPELEGTATNLETEQINFQHWRKIGKKYRYTNTVIYNADIQIANQYTGSVPSGGGPLSQPPSPEVRQEFFDLYEEQLEATCSINYQAGATLTGDISQFGNATLASGTFKFTGTGAYASTEALLNWDGTGTQPSGAQWQGTGTYQATGFFRGVGQFEGTGTWTGTKRPGRTLPQDYEDHPVNQAALKKAASIEATLIAGRAKAYNLQFAYSDIAEEWPPAQVVRVENDVFMLSGEVIRGENDRIIAEATGLRIGTDSGPGLVEVITLPPATLGTQGGRLDLSTQSGDAIAA